MKSKTGLKIFFVLLFLSVIFYGMKLFMNGVEKSLVRSQDFHLNEESFELMPYEKGEIAVVELNKTILDARKIIKKLIQAQQDPQFKAIILAINSPGGVVAPVQEIYREVRRIDAQKPVFATLGSIAASGGYYIAAACRKIYALPGTLTGSIGVIISFSDLSEVMEWAKIRPYAITSGKFKAAGASYKKMTLEEKNYFQELVNNSHEQFKKDILATRKERVKNLDNLAQGQIFTGEMALQAGLVDELASFWEAGRMIMKDLKLKGEFDPVYIRENKKIKLRDYFQVSSYIPMTWNSHYKGVPLYLYAR